MKNNIQQIAELILRMYIDASNFTTLYIRGGCLQNTEWTGIKWSAPYNFGELQEINLLKIVNNVRSNAPINFTHKTKESIPEFSLLKIKPSISYLFFQLLQLLAVPILTRTKGKRARYASKMHSNQGND